MLLSRPSISSGFIYYMVIILGFHLYWALRMDTQHAQSDKSSNSGEEKTVSKCINTWYGQNWSWLTHFTQMGGTNNVSISRSAAIINNSWSVFWPMPSHLIIEVLTKSCSTGLMLISGMYCTEDLVSGITPDYPCIHKSSCWLCLEKWLLLCQFVRVEKRVWFMLRINYCHGVVI